MARAGSVCGTCRFRSQCSTYRSWAEHQWTRNDVQLPLDSWGEIVEVANVDSHLCHVRLLDASRRYVRIANVPRAALAAHGPGAWIEAFELASAEVGRGTSYPCNLQVVDRRRPFRSAYSAQINVA